jgi:hypothetical protein
MIDMGKKLAVVEERITTLEMEIALMKYFGVRQNLIVPNISWGLYIHECDLLVVKKSGYAIEVEIKVSVQDFKKDFKKGHQHNDKFNRIKSMYYAFPKSIVDKCVDLVPENCGIISVRKYNGECYCHNHLVMFLFANISIYF